MLGQQLFVPPLAHTDVSTTEAHVCAVRSRVRWLQAVFELRRPVDTPLAFAFLAAQIIANHRLGGVLRQGVSLVIRVAVFLLHKYYQLLTCAGYQWTRRKQLGEYTSLSRFVQPDMAVLVALYTHIWTNCNQHTIMSIFSKFIIIFLFFHIFRHRLAVRSTTREAGETQGGQYYFIKCYVWVENSCRIIGAQNEAPV